jgi:RNA polymerase sigma-70 factor (ECF subfamily)
MTDDRALMRRIRQRDERAFAALVERHASRMTAVAARILGARADAEDAVQRAFLRCHLAAATYRPEWTVSTWLYRILTNICVDEIRRRKARREDRTPGLEIASAAGRGAAEPVSARIDVGRGLQRVPSEARVLLVLHYVDGLSYGELARVRGISVNTVKSQLARGKKILREALQQGGRR